MTDLILTTFDWVPEAPRGYVRDIRVRWALEEAGLPYRINSVPFRDRDAEHFSHQPFGQVPWLTDGDLSIFESGAMLLHLGKRSEALMSVDPHGRSEVAQGTLQALGRKSTVLPGFLSKLLTYSLLPLPRWVRVRIMGGVMKSMTKH